MWKLAVWTRKGGAGKSTIAACLGAFASSQGERVVLVDADPQGSLVAWYAQRTAETPPVAIGLIARLTSTLEAAAADGYTGAIIDLPGSLGPGEVRALATADLVLVPARPTFFDLAATAASIEVARAAKVATLAVLSQIRTRGREAAEVRAALADLSPVASAEIGERIAYQLAIAGGLGVTEFDPRSVAADEVRALYNDIRRIMP